jgi:hypothetical protein
MLLLVQNINYIFWISGIFHGIPGVLLGFPGFSWDFWDFYGILGIPEIFVGFGILGIRLFPLALLCVVQLP